MKEFVEFANHLADVSAEPIRNYYHNDFEIEHKQDNTPVTIADKKAEAVIRKAINHTFPQHGIIGEEYGNENTDADYVWVLDPIDGTVSFTIGRPIFATLIALLKNNKPVLGVVNQPITNDRWIGGVDVKAHRNDALIQVSQNTLLADAVIATTGPNYFTAKEWERFQLVSTKTRRVVYGGDCYNYALLASGTIDVIIESGLNVYDYAALIPLVKAAGGVITDWEGQEIICHTSGTKSIIAAANDTLLKQALEALRANEKVTAV
ncbi:MAG: histidinol-phosphatase [Rickettsiales bacterium]|nr:histidinol-phosphatase [Rickettsiales bacterium]